MSTGMDAVVEAAAFLDTYCKNKQWRGRVQTGILDMDSTDNCVLGQVYGDYGVGKTELRSVSSMGEWRMVTSTFANFTEEWAEYITDYYAKSQPDKFVEGSVWHVNGTPNFTVTFDHTFFKDGVVYCVFMNKLGDFQVRTKDSFLANYSPTVTYKDGGLYLGKDKRTVMIYDAERDQFLFLNGSNVSRSKVSWSMLSSTEETYGPLTEITSDLDGSRLQGHVKAVL